MSTRDPEKARESRRKYRLAHPERVKAVTLAWRKRNAEKCKEQRRKWQTTTRRANLKSEKAKYREGLLAKEAVYRAVWAGRLVRPNACSRCGKIGPVQAHHPDYSKPLEVIWLCADDHAKEHVKMRKEKVSKAPQR